MRNRGRPPARMPGISSQALGTKDTFTSPRSRRRPSGESLRLIAKGAGNKPERPIRGTFSAGSSGAAQLWSEGCARETVVRPILQANLGTVTVLIIAAHDLYQQVEVHGLRHDQIGKPPEIHQLLNVFGGVGRNQNDRYVRRSVHLETLHQFGAVHIWHAEIGDDYKGLVTLCKPQTLFRIIGRQHAIPFGSENLFNQFSLFLIVINDHGENISLFFHTSGDIPQAIELVEFFRCSRAALLRKFRLAARWVAPIRMLLSFLTSYRNLFVKVRTDFKEQAHGLFISRWHN